MNGNELAQCEAGVSTQNKPQRMDDAISSLSDVNFQLERLLQDMTQSHPDSEKAVGAPCAVASLQDIMNGGPDRIMQMREKALDQIHGVREILGL